MNRPLVTVIDRAGSLSRCDAMPLTQVQGLKLDGHAAHVAYAHDSGRETDDSNLSGEGPG
ncbi:MAG TPA: hypothetical protein VIN03_21745 [Roseateles sp.]